MCRVSRNAGSGFIGTGGFGNRQSNKVQPLNVTCSDDGEIIQLTLHSWTPVNIAGDTWRCLQFPFAESAKTILQSFVPVKRVRIKQVIDRGVGVGLSDGTIVTCRTSPCRPSASIDWFIQRDEDGEVQRLDSPTVREQIDTGRDKLSVTTSAVLFKSDKDHEKTVFCQSSNSKREEMEVTSQNISVRIKYPPSVEVYSKPSASVIEGTDVSLRCRVSGRPPPKLKWVKVMDDTTEVMDDGTSSKLVSLSPTFDLLSVTLTDGGTYTCLATNGLEPNASASVVLFIREAPVQRSVETSLSTVEAVTLSRTESESESSSSSSSSSGAVAGGVIAAIIVVLIIIGVVYFVYTRRHTKNRFLDAFSRQREDSEGQGIYATCSTLPRIPSNTLPPYVEVLPPSSTERKLGSVANPSYGTGDMIIAGKTSNSANKKRPLPSTPDTDEALDTGYAYIDESQVLGKGPLTSTSSGDTTCSNAYLTLETMGTVQDDEGYELPVSPSSSTKQHVKPVESKGKTAPTPNRSWTVHAISRPPDAAPRQSLERSCSQDETQHPTPRSRSTTTKGVSHH